MGVSTELVTAALLRYSGSVELEDTGDLRHDLVDYLVVLADLLSTTTGRAMQRVIQSARENPEVAPPVNRIFEQRLASLQQVVDHAVARGELPPVDGYFLAEMLTGARFTCTSAAACTRSPAPRRKGSRMWSWPDRGTQLDSFRRRQHSASWFSRGTRNRCPPLPSS
ncbi:TetR-like C-terminal domain-containing protein [Streptomyces mirabilis]|uniref:TetR-like C-terminal domain-containing protein n=1 Tax=Streptomyces mirabilis TaxID=68239 RepID=UPI0036803F84